MLQEEDLFGYEGGIYLKQNTSSSTNRPRGMLLWVGATTAYMYLGPGHSGLSSATDIYHTFGYVVIIIITMG